MKETPKVLAISGWLEQPLGQCVAFVVVSIAPWAATILAAMDKTETSMKAIAGGVGLVTAAIGRTFWICGLALTEAVDESLRKRQQQFSEEKRPIRRDARRAQLAAAAAAAQIPCC